MKGIKKVLGAEIKDGWEQEVYRIIFKSDTARGKRFDLELLAAIILSVIVVLLDSVAGIHEKWGLVLRILEWVFTIIFTIEYYLRIRVSPNKWKYVLSILGIIDLVSILPSYLSIIDSSYQYLLVLRSLRLLRIFKILNLRGFINAGRYITHALWKSYQKIVIFMLFITLVVLIIGSVMFIVEKDTPGFENIPNSIYWAVVTVTTVGYGDVSPVTPIGKFLSMLVMIGGYSVIAVPTGIITAEMARSRAGKAPDRREVECRRCGQLTHLNAAWFCCKCGEPLPDSQTTLTGK